MWGVVSGLLRAERLRVELTSGRAPSGVLEKKVVEHGGRKHGKQGHWKEDMENMEKFRVYIGNKAID